MLLWARALGVAPRAVIWKNCWSFDIRSRCSRGAFAGRVPQARSDALTAGEPHCAGRSVGACLW